MGAIAASSLPKSGGGLAGETVFMLPETNGKSLEELSAEVTAPIGGATA